MKMIEERGADDHDGDNSEHISKDGDDNGVDKCQNDSSEEEEEEEEEEEQEEVRGFLGSLHTNPTLAQALGFLLSIPWAFTCSSFGSSLPIPRVFPCPYLGFFPAHT